ncbi:MAG TPA: M90 family metallopeptidase [Rhodocyclaceae bacterium]|jgi:Mlc titration factor MtfA (ptsG expression regulator)|nr:M90 family metallopeptidase [Rhodocyclaceae bacterium]
MLDLIKRLFTSTANNPVSEAQWQAAEACLPFLAYLDEEERSRLRMLALDFIRRKSWQGAHALVITLEMQLVIALQACLLILKRDVSEYDGWVEIVLYPGDFIIPREVMDEDGIVHEYDDEVLGEAWDGGPLLLSWQEGGGNVDGINVVIHEFAHKLDMNTGFADGMPPLPDAAARRQWVRVFTEAYTRFCERVDSEETTEIDPYAAESPAEFFAVVSEVFFEAPEILKRDYADVYAELASFYRQTP